MIRVKEIQQLFPLIRYDEKKDCIDVIARLDNGESAAITVCTASHVADYLRENDMDYWAPDCDVIIVETLTLGCITRAIEAYIRDAGFYSRVRVPHTAQ